MSAADYGARISGIEAETKELRRAVDAIFGKLDTFTAAVADVRTALADLKAASGPSLQALMTMAAAGIVIIAAYTGSVVYLARSGMSEDMQKLRDRQTRMETILELATGGKARSTPGAWVPDAGWR